MKLTTYAWIMSAVVFVGTLPHAVGATFLQQTKNNTVKTEEQFSKPSISEMKKLAKRLGKKEVMARYNSKHEWYSLLALWNKESRWDYTAYNPKSSAFGIPQMLMMDKKTPMPRQIELGLKYIEHRYDKPSKALAFHNRNGWY